MPLPSSNLQPPTTSCYPADLYSNLHYFVYCVKLRKEEEIGQVYVLAVCGMGFGTSLMMLMNVQELGRKHGIQVRGEAVDLGSAKGREADLIVASSEIADKLSGSSVPVVGLSNLVDKGELERKVLPVLKELGGE
ncbi:PTS sugar transporter subunit IIB [Rubrobacter taiwanensis]|uniref:PTS sugar transporter subunit IIB n=1 Tax=Rubrobacter taiwanensis TaxID=185139 RepID=A0A4V2NW18_9ACTN|nr:PTS sugar transporter subunit IIB [Rubrobacter taiwanensis]